MHFRILLTVFYSRAFYFRDIREDYLFANIKRREYVYYMHFIHKIRCAKTCLSRI